MQFLVEEALVYRVQQSDAIARAQQSEPGNVSIGGDPALAEAHEQARAWLTGEA